MMYAPILTSVYDRLSKLKEFVNSLVSNREAIETDLYIAIDFPYKKEDESKHKEVVNFCKEISGFKSVNPIIREVNYGPYRNMREARLQLLNNYPYVITMTDDHVVSPNFLEYMNKALNFYEEDDRIFAITGYNYPVQMPLEYKHSCFLWPAFNGYGNGWWKSKFDYSYFDYNNFLDFLADKSKVTDFFNMANHVLPIIMAGLRKGISYGDAAITYNLYLNNRYLLWPTVSKVRNTGYDGSGIHCGINNMYSNQQIDDGTGEIEFIKDIQPDKEIYEILKKFCKISEPAKFSLEREIQAYMNNAINNQLNKAHIQDKTSSHLKDNSIESDLKNASTITAQADIDPYDIAYKWGWSQPQLRELVYLCYKTPNFADNARRYYTGHEFQEAVRVLSELGKKPDRNVKVLDFGCGNGVASYALARTGFSVVGVDSSLGELAGLNAAKKIQGLDGAHFELVHSTGEKIDFPENSFDVVWIREALHHIKSLKEFLSEINRILKPEGIVCCLRDVVIWNENQRSHFFATHPFNHITKDEGCYYLAEYLSAFSKSGLLMEKTLYPGTSVINTYPDVPNPGITFDENKAKQRQQGYDLFSFFARKPQAGEAKILPAQELQGVRVNIGKDVQIIGSKNIQLGNGSCIGDNVWLNVCLRDEHLRMKIGKCVLVGRQSVISTAGYLEIGDYCVLAPRVFVSDADHVFADIYQPVIQQGTTNNRSIVIEENCWLGLQSVVTGNLTIGRCSVVAANAVVTKDVPPFSVVAGVPAKIIKMYNPATKVWERIKDQAHIAQIMKIREDVGMPNREEHRRILEKNARIRYIDPIFAGKGINI